MTKLIVSSYLLLFSFTLFHASVLGDGLACSQMGAGPDDMIMESPSGLMSMNPKYQWDKRGHVVRLPIVLDHAYTHKERGVIFGGLQEIASKTCVKFAVHKDHHYLRGHDYVYISKTKSKGCWSYVGRVGNGKQDLSLPIGCINHRTVVHEVMHALGFSHEHVRHDRDNYVEILWGNIQRGRERNFEKKHGRADPFGPYDYESIMHYERNAFSNNGHDTIRPLKGHVPIGKGRHMSHWDVVKINRMYKCGGGGGGYSSPFFGGLSGHPEGNDVDDVSYDDNGITEGGSSGAADDDSENEVYNGIDHNDNHDPAFGGIFPGSSPSGRPSGPSQDPRGYPTGSFSHPRGPPHPGPRGLPLLTGPGFGDAPRHAANKGGHLASPVNSFPDNPFATIPSNPFSPRFGLPANAVDQVDETPATAGADYYENPQDININKDFFNY